jgi:Protein of unknown function (DUF2829)
MEPQDFGWAIRRLKEGKRVAREGWNGKGMWLFLAKTDSLIWSPPRQGDPTGGVRTFTPSVCMKTAQDTIVVGWLASQTDMLSDDWFEVS